MGHAGTCIIFRKTRGDTTCIHRADKLDPGHAHFYQYSELTIVLSVTAQKVRDPETLEFGEVPPSW